MIMQIIWISIYNMYMDVLSLLNWIVFCISSGFHQSQDAAVKGKGGNGYTVRKQWSDDEDMNLEGIMGPIDIFTLVGNSDCLT